MFKGVKKSSTFGSLYFKEFSECCSSCYLCMYNFQYLYFMANSTLAWTVILILILTAANAKELLNFAPINGKPIRIMFSHRDPSIRKSGYANLFIKNLDKSIDNKALLDTFSSFGTVLSCKVAADASGQSKGYGFVQYDNEESSETAMAKLNGMLINDKKIDIKRYVRSQRSNTFQNIYVKNLPETTTDEELKNLFRECGEITSVAVMRDGNGKSRCFGFVNFEDPGNAVAAIDKFNGTTLNDKVLFVGKAQKKPERQAELRSKFEQERISRFEKLQGANLYLKNLDDSINNDEKLKELFSEFGTITSCKVMLYQLCYWYVLYIYIYTVVCIFKLP